METTIVISNYFKKEFIKDAVESVMAQTYQDWKLIIVDDTNGKDSLKDYESYRNTSVIETDDIGVSALRMRGAQMGDGRYILFLDADDKIHPTFLQKTTDILNEYKEISFVYTDTQHFGDSKGFWLQPEYSFHNLLIQNYICYCSPMRLDSFFDVGGYDLDNFNYWEDYELWIALGAKGYYGKHLAEKLFYYRVYPHASGMVSKRNQILSPVYKSYIIKKFPVLFSDQWNEQASSILKKYPSDIMKWKPYQQEEYLKSEGLLE